jgi:hypothetical protein
VAVGMMLWNFHFQIFEKAIAKEKVVEFFAHLVRHLHGLLPIVSDGFLAQRSRLVADFVQRLKEHIVIEYPPLTLRR